MQKGVPLGSVPVILVSTVIMVLALAGKAFSQEEPEVIQRYDYSSPAASFQSLKQAIQDEDIEGVLIHEWECLKSAQGSVFYGKSFDEAVAVRKADYLRYGSEKSLFEDAGRIYQNNLKVTEVEFDRESECFEEEGAKACNIVLKRESDGKEAMAVAFNFAGSPYWWVMVAHSGE